MERFARCRGCGAQSSTNARYCDQCGASLSRTDTVEERRQVTVLFSDASGYTGLAEDLDPEHVRELMAEVYACAEEIVARYGGRVDKLMGDALLAVFGDPVTHEDDAERAVRTAFDLHQAVDGLAPRFAAVAGRTVSMHSGINSGVIVTGHHTDVRSGPLGDMVNVAARLQSLAGPDEVLAGPETVRLLRDRFPTADLGDRTLRGRRDAVQVFRIERAATGAGITPSRRSGDFIGRHEELGVLAGAVERLRDGERSLVTICAEAGAGKSRLFEEFRSQLAPDVQWLEGRAFPYTASIPYAPVIDLIDRAAGIDERDGTDAVSAKLTALAERTLPGHERAVTVLLQLYELVPAAEAIDLEAFRSELLEVMRSLIDAVAARAPTVVCLQDLHWVDPSTVELLRQLASTGHQPIVTICNFRPGFELGAEGERALELAALSPRQTRQQLVSLLDGLDPPDELADAVVDRTEGNPFFVEEVVNRLLETGALVREGERWRMHASLDEVGIPGTIRGLIATRIDALSSEHRRVLREASVMGREFVYRLVERITVDPTGLDATLGDLVGADLIREKAVDPELEYIFKHALIQEVAYEGLVRRERQQLHERVACAIETAMPDRIPELVETLAYHWERSGHGVEAVTYLRRSGRKALERSALAEARDHYERAISLLSDESPWLVEPLPEAVTDRLLVEVILEYAQVHYYSGTFGALDHLMTEHADTLRRVGDDAMTSRWMAWTGHVQQFGHGEVTRAIELLERAASLGEACGDAIGEAYARSWLLWGLWEGGRASEARPHWTRIQALLPEVHDEYHRRYLEIKSLGGVAFCEIAMARLRPARRAAERLIAIGAERGTRRASSMGHVALIDLHFVCGDVERARAAADDAAQQGSDPVYQHAAHVWSAAIDAFLGDPARARATISRSRPDCFELNLHAFVTVHDALEAFVSMAEGQLSRGARDAARLRADAVRRGHRFQVAMIDVSLAVAHARTATGEASGSAMVALRNPGFVLRHVVGVARRARRELQELVSELPQIDIRKHLPLVHWELARLDAHQGRTEEARRHAQTVVDLLAEEPDAAYVSAANELLAEL